MADDDDDLPNMALIDRLEEARVILDDVARDLDPRGRMDDKELYEIVFELCQIDPPRAAHAMVEGRRRMYRRLPSELTKLLGLTEKQHRRLAQWCRDEAAKIEIPKPPDVFEIVKKP